MASIAPVCLPANLLGPPCSVLHPCAMGAAHTAVCAPGSAHPLFCLPVAHPWHASVDAAQGQLSLPAQDAKGALAGTGTALKARQFSSQEPTTCQPGVSKHVGCVLEGNR